MDAVPVACTTGIWAKVYVISPFVSVYLSATSKANAENIVVGIATKCAHVACNICCPCVGLS